MTFYSMVGALGFEYLSRNAGLGRVNGASARRFGVAEVRKRCSECRREYKQHLEGSR